MADLFEMDGKVYLLVMDYFSRYMEVQTWSTTTSASIIQALKAIFFQHGIPAMAISDNGPEYNLEAFRFFSQEYNFNHVTSSPHYPQSNGLIG